MNVEFDSGPDRIRGALHLPDAGAGAGAPAPGVVVIPDVWGLGDHYHEIAQRLASTGFAALAIDLYSRGEQPDASGGMDAVHKFMRELPDARVLADLQAAIDYLRSRPEVSDRIGITGFCMGGKYAILAACSCQGLSAAAAWYGMLRVGEIDTHNPEHPLDALERLGCPLLGLFGAEDPVVPAADVAELERRASAASLDVDVVVYQGAGHAFHNDTRPDAYRPEAAKDGWRRMLALFERKLVS